MSILAIDPGHRTGWARSGGRTGTFDLKVYDDHGQAIAMYQDWLSRELASERPAVVIVELCLFPSRMRNVHLTIGVMIETHSVCWAHKIPRREMSAISARKALSGSGRAKDSQMAPFVARHGFYTTVSHEIDAAALLIACEAAASARRAA